jgi:intein-encoded DNA endonuclease-like protein
MNKKILKKVNQDFFKNWSSNMAYILGYFVADGCITSSKGRISNPYTFNITSIDLSHLNKITKAIKSNYKISKKFGSFGNVAYHIQVRNSVLSNDLMNLGIHPRKTYELKPIKVPEQYFSDYVRGFFDGDGTVYIQKVNGTLQIKSGFIAVSLSFISDFNTRLCDALNIPKKSVHVHKSGQRNRMTKYNICFYIDDSEKLAEFMYGNNPGLYLGRKKEIFDLWKLTKRRVYRKNNYPSKIGWNFRKV